MVIRMNQFVTFLATGSLLALGLATPSYGQIHVYVTNPNQLVQPGPYGNLIGSQVYDQADHRVGTLSGIVNDPQTGQPLYGVVSTGGIYGVGTTEHPVPWQLFTPGVNGVHLNYDRNRLDSSPSFIPGNPPDLLSQDWQRMISDYFGIQPMHGGYSGNRAGADPFLRMFNANDVQSIRGTITRVYHHTQGDFVQVLVQTDNGRTIIAVLAPESYLENTKAEPRQGETIELRGSRAVQNGREFFIATSMRAGNQQFRLRNDDGTPLWDQQQLKPQQGPINPELYQNGH